MNELIKKETLTLDSREVAGMVDKEHSKLLRDIRIYIEYLGEAKIGQSDFFIESTYVNSQNKTQPCYQVTKKGCEFIAHKLTGQKGAVFTAKYINRFHEMEDTIKKPKTAIEMLELQFNAIKEVDSKVDSVDKDLQEFKKDMPLLALECDRITTAVRSVGVRRLGGKESNAYQDRSLRGKVYSDIYNQLKREFGVTSYKAIKRSQSQLAVDIVKSYKLPFALYDEINDYNAQLHF